MFKCTYMYCLYLQIIKTLCILIILYNRLHVHVFKLRTTKKGKGYCTL